ncbi:hypothetical protein EUX98_g7128 [Antrodiella citrinella]|uniref:TERF2-interacting telomeric protein 1 Myb domain-containing protein n=1 Tax=Antrodiella citrinella TaxID=2447956 RepID=A0A4V3XHX1_9APHY|nr:hypothetical protein EUX98_g7128 [Antrodiella citrinella]
MARTVTRSRTSGSREPAQQELEEGIFIDEDGNPVKFFFYTEEDGKKYNIPVAAADALGRKVRREGGDVVDDWKLANVVIVQDAEAAEARGKFFSSCYEYRLIWAEPMGFIDRCIREQMYRHSQPVIKGMPGRPGGRVRVPFTTEDDAHLAEYIALRFPDAIGGGRTGNLAYQELDEIMDWTKRHTWQSWRERYTKHKVTFNRMIEELHFIHPPLPGRRGADARDRRAGRGGRGFVRQYSGDEDEQPQFDELAQDQQDQRHSTPPEEDEDGLRPPEFFEHYEGMRARQDRLTPDAPPQSEERINLLKRLREEEEEEEEEKEEEPHRVTHEAWPSNTQTTLVASQRRGAYLQPGSSQASQARPRPGPSGSRAQNLLSQVTLVGSPAPQRKKNASSSRHDRPQYPDEAERAPTQQPQPKRNKIRHIRAVTPPDHARSDEFFLRPAKTKVDKGKQRATEVVLEAPPEREPSDTGVQSSESYQDEEAVVHLVSDDLEHNLGSKLIATQKAAVETSPDDQRTGQHLFGIPGSAARRPLGRSGGSRASSVAMASATHWLPLSRRGSVVQSSTLPQAHETFRMPLDSVQPETPIQLHNTFRMPNESDDESVQSSLDIPLDGTRASAEKEKRIKILRERSYAPPPGSRAAKLLERRRMTMSMG